MTVTRSTNSTDREIATDDAEMRRYLSMKVQEDGRAVFTVGAVDLMARFTLRPVEMAAFIRFYQERVDNE